MDERDDEDAAAAQLIDDSPRMRGDFADLRIIEFWYASADARGLSQSGGACQDVAHNGLGVDG